MNNETDKIGVGLVGFGTIGQGVASLLIDPASPAVLKTGLQLRLVRICDVDLDRPREVAGEPALPTRRPEATHEDNDSSTGC